MTTLDDTSCQRFRVFFLQFFYICQFSVRKCVIQSFKLKYKLTFTRPDKTHPIENGPAAFNYLTKLYPTLIKL